MKKLLLVTGIIVAVLGAGYLVYLRQETAHSRNSTAYFRSGQQYYEAGRYREAIIQFLNALQKDPQQRDSRYLLAQSYVKQQQSGQAVKELRTLLRYHPEDREAKLQLGNVYLAAGVTDKKFFRDAEEIAKDLLTKDPNDVDALVLAGSAAAGLTNLASSVEMLEKAISLDPDNVTAFVSLGMFQTLRRNYPEAEKALLRARDLDGKNKRALRALAHYYRAVGSVEKAEQVLNDALSFRPGDSELYLSLVQLYQGLGRFDSVVEVLRKAQDSMPQNPEPSLVLVDFYLSRNLRDSAVDLIEELKKRFPHNIAVAKKIAVVFIKSDPERARKEVDQSLQASPRDPEGLILLGQVQFYRGLHQEAVATFEKSQILRRSYPQPHFFLGRIAALRGDRDASRRQYHKALEVDPAYLPARLALAETYLQQKRFEDSLAELRRLLEMQPDHLEGRLLRTTVDTALGHYIVAEHDLSVLLRQHRTNDRVHHAMGRYYQQRGMTGAAEKSYLTALELHPGSESVLSDLVQLYLANNLNERAIRKINDIAPEGAKKALHHELLGQAHFKAGNLDAAETAFRKVLEMDPGRLTSYILLGGLCFQRNRLDEGFWWVDQLLRRNPSFAPAYALNGAIYHVQGKLDLAKQNYARALEIDSRNATAANNLAYILAEESRDLDIALKWAQSARKVDAENAGYADTLGWIYYKKGNFILARDQLRFAAAKQPDNPVVQYHLAMASWKTNVLEEARIALKRALKSNVDFKERQLAEAALREIGVGS